MTPDVVVRDVRADDLPIFFEQQMDEEARLMAAFTAKNATDWEAYIAHWEKILHNDNLIKQTIVADGEVAGHLLSFMLFDQPSVGYWLGRRFWGKGIATRALSLFLRQIPTRPLYARAVKDNQASLRVLEKCGFVICGEDKIFSNARGVEVEEYILMLAADDQGAAA